MTVLGDREYDELKKFLKYYSGKYEPALQFLPEDQHPFACLELLEKRSRKMASQGLLQTINDILDEKKRANPHTVSEIDSDLRQNGLVSLSELRRRFSRKYRKVLERGEIKDDAEYYMLVASAADMSTSNLEARAMLLKMIEDYEAQSVKRK